MALEAWPRNVGQHLVVDTDHPGFIGTVWVSRDDAEVAPEWERVRITGVATPTRTTQEVVFASEVTFVGCEQTSFEDFHRTYTLAEGRAEIDALIKRLDAFEQQVTT